MIPSVFLPTNCVGGMNQLMEKLEMGKQRWHRKALRIGRFSNEGNTKSDWGQMWVGGQVLRGIKQLGGTLERGIYEGS